MPFEIDLPPKTPGGVTWQGTAEFSQCMTWRYLLTRGDLKTPYALFIMLNPSTATATENDPTISWCWRFVQSRGGLSLRVCNIFAFRATDPKVMLAAHKTAVIDIVGPENNKTIREQAKGAHTVICAWGAHGAFLGRGNQVARMLKNLSVVPHALRVSEKTGQPWHPLYLPGDVKPFVFHPR